MKFNKKNQSLRTNWPENSVRKKNSQTVGKDPNAQGQRPTDGQTYKQRELQKQPQNLQKS